MRMREASRLRPRPHSGTPKTMAPDMRAARREIERKLTADLSQAASLSQQRSFHIEFLFCGFLECFLLFVFLTIVERDTKRIFIELRKFLFQCASSLGSFFIIEKN